MDKCINSLNNYMNKSINSLNHYMDNLSIQKTRGPQAEYHRLYTDFLSEGLILVYQQPHHRINENQRWYRKAAS